MIGLFFRFDTTLQAPSSFAGGGFAGGGFERSAGQSSLRTGGRRQSLFVADGWAEAEFVRRGVDAPHDEQRRLLR